MSVCCHPRHLLLHASTGQKGKGQGLGNATRVGITEISGVSKRGSDFLLTSTIHALQLRWLARCALTSPLPPAPWRPPNRCGGVAALAASPAGSLSWLRRLVCGCMLSLTHSIPTQAAMLPA